MMREIKKPITLRIKQADILESQLSDDDLRALRGGADEGGVLCPGTYCSGGYSSKIESEDIVTNPMRNKV